MTRRALAVIAAGATGLGLVACSGPSPAVPVATTTTTASAKPPPPPETWASAPWTASRSPRFHFKLPLPSLAGWKIDDASDPWFSARDPVTQTSVVVRIFTIDGLASHARCEAHARELRKLPERADATIVDERRIDLPNDFDTTLAVGVYASQPGAPISGTIWAFGGWARKCFAYVLTTTAAGPGAEERVADRLALMVEQSLLRMKFESDLTPTVPREPLPGDATPAP